MTAIKPLVGVSACRIEVNGLSMQRCSEKYLMAMADEVAATPMIIPSLPTPLDVASMIARLDGLLLTGSPSNVEPGITTDRTASRAPPMIRRATAPPCR